MPELDGEERQRERKALPICQKCQSYKVTWELARPHACLFFGFKSAQLPAVEVYNSTGMVCPQYRGSARHAQQAARDFHREVLEASAEGDTAANSSPNGELGRILGEKGILF